MGKKNTITKDYMSVPEHFADCFNYYLFDGRQIIKPSNLQPLDPTEITIVPEGTSDETVEKIRDLLKQCIVMKDEKTTYLLLGIENQSEIHYALPVKNMNYDAINYGKQVSDIAKLHRKKKDIKDSGEFLSGFTKEDKLKPIITLTIYFGADKWDAPRSLKEMFEEIDESIMNFVEDYKVHLIVPNEIEDFGKFKTDFGKVMKYIAISKDKKALSQLRNDEAFKSVDVETVRLINEYTNSNISINEGEESVDMCKGLEDWKEDIILEERKQLLQHALNNGKTIEEFSEFMGISVSELEQMVSIREQD